MDGSLVKKSDFFSDVSNLVKALPVPQTNQLTNNTPGTATNLSGFTIINSIVINAEEMSEDILDFIFNYLSCAGGQKASAKGNLLAKKQFLSTDIKKRSPVFLAISRGNTKLANRMLSSSLHLEASVPADSSFSSQPGSVSINNDGLSFYFLKRSADNVSTLESELDDRLQGSYRKDNVSGALMQSLMIHLDRIEVLWDYLQTKCEISTLSRLIYDPSGQVVDCFQRAKSILLHLNIPFSQLHNKLVERKDAKSGAAGTGEEEAEEEAGQSPLELRFKNLSPEKIKQLIPWKTAMELKSIVQGWVKLRTRRDSQEGGTRSAAQGSSLQSIYASKMAHVMKQQPNCYPSVSKDHLVEYPFKQAFAEIESSVLLYHSLDLSLVTYGFSSVGDAGNEKENEGVNASARKRHFQARDTLWNSPFPPLILAETRHLREKKKSDVDSVRHMAHLLMMYKKNASAMQRAVQCAYAILEFARTLSTTRILVTLTQEAPCADQTVFRAPSMCNGTHPDADCFAPSSSLPCLRKPASSLSINDLDKRGEESARHPVDAIRHAIIFARDNFNTTKSFVTALATSAINGGDADQDGDTSETKLIHRANRVIENDYLSHGAGSRIRLTDGLSDVDMREFLTMKSEISPTFTNLRHILIESLLILMDNNPSAMIDNSLIVRLENYLTRNSVYDERVMLEGGDDDSMPLSQKECEQLSEQLLFFMKNISIKSITGVKLDLASAENNVNQGIEDASEDENSSISPFPAFAPQLPGAIIEKLFKHILAHPTVFCHDAAVPTRGKFSSYGHGLGRGRGAPQVEAFVPLSQCPSVTEQADILNLVGCSGGGDKEDASYRTGAALRACLRALNGSYRLSETIIELILTVIGLHSMGHVYLLDFNNSSGGLKCSPYISLCYTPVGSESVTEQVKRENDIVDCFLLLRKCGIELNYTHDLASGYFNDNSVLVAANVFSEYSELQYSIFCAAVFGKARLLGELVATENQLCLPDAESTRQRSCLIWYVLLICPPPSNNYADYNPSGSFQGYATIVLLLIKNGFGVAGPSGSQLSVVDLAALKQLPEVVSLLLHMCKEEEEGRRWEKCSLLHLGAFHFITLSKKFDAATLQLLLSMQDFDYVHAVSSDVSLENFIPACINDSEIFASMFEFICSHIETYRQFAHDGSTNDASSLSKLSKLPHEKVLKASTLEDVLKTNVVGVGRWNLDISVHLLAQSLLGIFHSFDDCRDLDSHISNRSKHCPLYNLVSELTTEVLNTEDFHSETELSTIVKSLGWSNIHFILCSKAASKFQTFFTHFFSPASVSEGHLLLPLFETTDSTFGQVPRDLLHYICFYSMGESLQVLIDYSDSRSGRKELDYFNNGNNLFFAPLNSSMTPLDVALEVGSTACVSILLNHAKDNLSFQEVNNVSWKMIYASLGRGLGGEEMAVLLLGVISSLHVKYGKKQELTKAVNMAIVNNIPRTGVVSQETLLHLSARRGFVQLCALLLQAGADASATCSVSGLSAINTSIASGHRGVTRVLGPHCIEERDAAVRIALMFRSRVLNLRKTQSFR
jgi:hypothetical protein